LTGSNTEIPGDQGPIRPTRWPAAFRSLRHRDFRWFWITLLVSVSGTWMQTTTQALLVYNLTKSALYLGFVGACASLPMLLFTLPAGVIADRVPKQRIITVTQTLAAIQAFLLAALVHYGAVRVWHVMVLASMLGVVNAFDMPPRQAMVVELVGHDDLFNAISLNSTAFNSGRIIGPTLAGMLVAATSMEICFFMNGLSFLPLIVVLMFIRPRRRAFVATGGFSRQIGEGLAWVRSNRVAFALLAFTAVSGIFAMPYTSLLPIFADKILHAGPRGYGFLWSSPGLGALVAALSMTFVGHRVRLGAAVTAGTFIFPIALLLFAAAPHYAAAVVCLFIVGIGMMSFNMVSNTILQKSPPDELRGRVMSLRAFVFVGLAPLGNLQIGAMGQWFGAQAAVAAGASISLLCAVIALWRAPEILRAD
jgi:MFS family permease